MWLILRGLDHEHPGRLRKSWVTFELDLMCSDLDHFTVEGECPRCGFHNPLFFKQARLRDVLICRGCKANIQLDDRMNSCRKAVRSFRRQMQQLEEQLGSLSRTLRL